MQVNVYNHRRTQQADNITALNRDSDVHYFNKFAPKRWKVKNQLRQFPSHAESLCYRKSDEPFQLSTS